MDKFSLKVTFHKKGEMIYFSQLDIMRILERALRRTHLPLYFTQGFTPRVKMSFSNALKLGVEGEENVILYFREKIDVEIFKKVIISQLPEGLEIIDCLE